MTLLNTIVANHASCNLVAPSDIQNANPLLGPLASNGGSTPTHALQAGSPAIDAGTATSLTIGSAVSTPRCAPRG